jgi:hypothetical protein
MVYLIHFDKLLGGHAQHYIGFTEDVDARELRHYKGNGARILAACVEKGINFNVVRIWPGDRKLERKLKKRKNNRILCPKCNKSAMTNARATTGADVANVKG